MKITNLLEKIHDIQSKEIIRKFSSMVFYIALITEIVIVLVDKSALSNPTEGRLFQMTFCLFLLKVIFTEYSLKEYLFIVLFGIFGLWIDQAAGRNEILRFVIFIAACKDIDIKKALKLTLYLTAAGCTILALLSVTGLFGGLTVIKEYPGEYIGENTKTLFAFGMGNANAFHCMFFSLILLALYIYNESMKLWVYAAIIVADMVLFMITDSKTGFALTIIAVIGMWIAKKMSGSKLLGKLCIFSNIACFAVSVWFAAEAWRVYYITWFNQLGDQDDDRLIVRLDRMLTGRIGSLTGSTNWEGAIQSWRWLPQRHHEMYFDLGFVRLFYWYGIIAALILLILLVLLQIYLYKNGKTTELVFISLIVLYTVVEAHFVSVYIARNYLLFLVGAFWNLIVLVKEDQLAKA